MAKRTVSRRAEAKKPVELATEDVDRVAHPN